MPDKATLLAFDLGASTGRALIGEWSNDGGKSRLQVSEIHRFPNDPVQVGKHLHWNILRLVQEIKNGISIAFRKGYHPETFGIDTWGVDFGLLDRNGELLGNPYHYRDPQTEGLIEEIDGIVGREELFAQSGLQFMPFNTVYQLAAMVKAKSPKLDAAETLLLTPDLLVYLLTGKRNCEFTMATTTQLLNPTSRSWNIDLMDRLQIPSRLFLPITQPGEKIAPLSPEVCMELGVPPINAIAVATHDTESAVVAVPAAKDQPFIYLVCGTWSLLGTEREEPLLSLDAMQNAFSNEGGAGGTFQLLKNIMGLWILQECKREWDAKGLSLSYPELVARAEEAEPFRSLINPDDLRFYGAGGMEVRIREYCRETGQPIPQFPGEVTRCILESLALRYRQAVEQLESMTGLRYNGLHMVGGGIQNRLFCQFTANALGRKVWAGPVEASAIGNMLIQLISRGHCSNLEEARKLVAFSFEVDVYEANQTERWEQAYEAYLNIAKEE